MASINQTGAGIRLPNFCNLGVMLRVIVLANVFCVAFALARAASPAAAAAEFLALAAFAEPALIASLVGLCAARRALHAMGYGPSIAAVAAFELAIAGLLHFGARALFPELPAAPFGQVAFLVLFVTGCVLVYFDLRSRSLSPAVAEARIQALQARIRPHFLYNTLNAVLGLMRSEPRRAERALEDMADVFRVLMADHRTLATVGDEVALAKRYLDIEAIRLGERLRVDWRIEGMPEKALIPPLVLQPLVENAVYHGIEPFGAGGAISIAVARAGDQLVVTLENPYPAEVRQSPGNRMALANIRERLQLHYDAEASMASEARDGLYRVTIRVPFLTAPA